MIIIILSERKEGNLSNLELEEEEGGGAEDFFKASFVNFLFSFWRRRFCSTREYNSPFFSSIKLDNSINFSDRLSLSDNKSLNFVLN